MLTNRHAARRLTSLFATLLVGGMTSSLSLGQEAADRQQPTTADDALAALKADNERLKGLVPSQSHAMMDVAYHFTNLWFAGEHANWPLAQFYFNEARSHIRWAIRIVPVRRTSAGELKLEEMYAGFDSLLLAAIQKEITARDRKGFETAYRQALSGCNACHTAAEKPFLHVKIPDAPEAHIVDFNPQPAVK